MFLMTSLHYWAYFILLLHYNSFQFINTFFLQVLTFKTEFKYIKKQHLFIKKYGICFVYTLKTQIFKNVLGSI